jgi:nitroreductase
MDVYEAIMDVYEAVTSRRAVRGFTDEPVSRVVLERVLSAAVWSPSGLYCNKWQSEHCQRDLRQLGSLLFCSRRPHSPLRYRSCGEEIAAHVRP